MPLHFLMCHTLTGNGYLRLLPNDSSMDTCASSPTSPAPGGHLPPPKGGTITSALTNSTMRWASVDNEHFRELMKIVWKTREFKDLRSNATKVVQRFGLDAIAKIIENRLLSGNRLTKSPELWLT